MESWHLDISFQFAHLSKRGKHKAKIFIVKILVMVQSADLDIFHIQIDYPETESKMLLQSLPQVCVD